MSPSSPRRSRADERVCALGLASTRAKAQALIMAGEVFSESARIDKPGTLVAADAVLRVAAKRRFVSRGGDKLDGALNELHDHFAHLHGVVALDIGASTGGFTDCLLQRGASRVYAIDVGHGQLDAKLLADPRVVSRERTNARDLSAADFPEPIRLVVVDASFIGIDKLLPAIARVLVGGGELVALVKPQFEAGREEVSRGRGVIRDAGVRASAIEKGREAIRQAGFTIVGEVDSPITGPKGNLERFVYGVSEPRSSDDAGHR